MTINFSDICSIGVGEQIKNYTPVSNRLDLKRHLDNLVRDFPGEPVFVVAGGTNILPSDASCGEHIVHLLPSDTVSDTEAYNQYIWAGNSLDSVAWNLNLAELSGIPGSIGGAVVQNAGAYGASISDFVHSVEVYDVLSKRYRVLSPAQCAFGYRTSIFKQNEQNITADSSPKPIVTGVRIIPQPDTLEVRFDQLAKALRVQNGDRLPAEKVRASVLELRDSKGMLAPGFGFGQADDSDRRSCGSFWTNPIVPEFLLRKLPSCIPVYPADSPGYVKVSAAALIENAGFCKGFALDGHASAGISSKHCLALINRDVNNSSAGHELRELKSVIEATVLERFSVALLPEPVIL
ncbi:MAG: FAD-binding protein [Candidatus Ancillula sp.]|jgi:UDP-N-acetylmuramate dehydrogenase|nr:FAD-binding protein [Candidatus Ancillula sp.]